jgi:hypothetical protein
LLLVGASVAAQAGCGGRYEVVGGSGGPAVAFAGAPGEVTTDPGSVAGAPGFAGSFAVGGGFEVGGSFGVAGSFEAGGSFGAAGAPTGGFAQPCRLGAYCELGLHCSPADVCLPVDSMGGSGGGGGSVASPSVCDGLGTKALDLSTAKLDDFEASVISPGWSAYADLGPPGPDPTDNLFSVARVSPGAALTSGAGQYKGTGGNPVLKPPGFGVGAILNVALDPTSGVYCADISAFDGVSFWAKSGVADTVFDVAFIIPATNARSPDPKFPGGDCLTGCYNHPRKRVALSGAWEQYTVRFFDAAGGSAKVKNLIQEIAWVSPDSTWDFSLDEITFYKGTPPPGALGNSGIK